MNRSLNILWALVLFGACRMDPESPRPIVDEVFYLEVPQGFPYPVTTADNPLTRASVELGKTLFFDPRLSRDGTISCASCHFPERAFSDTTALSQGIEGRMGMRNAPTLANVGYHTSFFRDGGVHTLEEQVLSPVHDPVEMDHDITVAAAALKDAEPYLRMSMQAYGRELDIWVITRAIANYERTLISGWSRYDRFLQGDAAAMTDAEVRGWQIFNGPVANCSSCHSGFDLSDHDFYNIGQYLDYQDPGRQRITHIEGDRGKFKVPTLRNIALTAPYMHDGSMITLEQVITHFESGGEAHPNKSTLVQPFNLTAEEKGDLISFLHALTDERSIDQLP